MKKNLKRNELENKPRRRRMPKSYGPLESLAQIEHAVSEAKKHGIARAHGFFLIGSPGETEEDFQQTMSLLEAVRFDGSFSFFYNPRPGTPATPHAS